MSQPTEEVRKQLLGDELYEQCSLVGKISSAQIQTRLQELGNTITEKELVELCEFKQPARKLSFTSAIDTPLVERKCHFRENIDPNTIIKEAAELGIAPYKLLQQCDMHDVKFIAGNDKIHSLSTDADIAKVTSKLPQYSYLETLGEGTYGVVYHMLYDKKYYAAKLFKGEYANVDYNEIDLLTRWQHPNVLHAHRLLWDHQQRVGILLPLAKGLMDINIAAVDPSIRTRWIVDLLNGMAFIQSQGFFHCDMKPENCLIVTIDGSNNFNDVNNLRLVVADMGLSYPYEYAKEICGTYVYSPLEMYPQWWSKQFGVTIPRIQKTNVMATDMYLVGNTILYILTGELIFGPDPYTWLDPGRIGNIAATIQAFIATKGKGMWSQRKVPAGFSPQMLQCVEKMLAYEPQDRPQYFIDCLAIIQSPITIGQVVEAVPSRDLTTLSSDELAQLAKQATAIADWYAYAFKKTHWAVWGKYDNLLNALTLLYRSYPAFDSICDVAEITAACINLAARLAWQQYMDFTDPNVSNSIIIPNGCNVAGAEKRIPLYMIQICMYLRGTLRFPFLFTSATSKEELKRIVQMSMKQPKKFIEMMMPSPNVVSAPSAVSPNVVSADVVSVPNVLEAVVEEEFDNCGADDSVQCPLFFLAYPEEVKHSYRLKQVLEHAPLLKFAADLFDEQVAKRDKKIAYTKPIPVPIQTSFVMTPPTEGAISAETFYIIYQYFINVIYNETEWLLPEELVPNVPGMEVMDLPLLNMVGFALMDFLARTAYVWMNFEPSEKQLVWDEGQHFAQNTDSKYMIPSNEQELNALIRLYD